MKTLKLFIISCILLISLISGAQNISVYVSDAGNFSSPPWQILKFDENGENPEVFIDDNLVWPQDIVFLEDQEVVLISNLSSSGYISRHDINTGAFIENFASGISGPTRMKIGADDLLYVLQWSNSNNKVLRYQLDGTFVDEFTSVGVAQSIGLDWDDDGNLYVSSYGGDFVQKFDSEGNDMGEFISSNLVGPTNIWFEDNGDLMVVDYDGGSVKQFDSEGNYLGIYISGLSNPEGIDFFSDGKMLIGNGGAGAVKLYDDEGTYIEDFIPSGSGNLLRPNAVIIRETTSVNILKHRQNEIFIMPGFGKNFHINQKLSRSLKRISIYNTAGIPQENVEFLKTGNWNAENVLSGVYIVVAEKWNNEVLMQKILVQ